MKTSWVKPGSDTVALFTRAAGERWGWKPSRPAVGARWLNGSVRLMGKEDCTGCAANRPHSESLTDPNDEILVHADKILKSWPEARAEAVVLLDEILSFRPVGAPFSLPAGGGSCGPWKGWGSIMVEASNPVGYAEGVLHELGHHKLRALYIDMEEHDGSILLNTSDELYESGVRKDKPRPMSAVLHAHYSYLHVTEIELRAHNLGYSMEAMLPHQVRRLTEGRAVIAEHARWTDAGASARDEIMAWTDDLLTRCAALGARI